MVAGHLQEKNDFYYIVLSYKDAAGKRKTKWEATGLSVKRNKKKAEALLLERRRNFMVPTAPAEIRLDDDILFSDFMLKWLEVAKSTIQITTYASYQGMVDVCMVMDHRICLDPFKLFGIEILQIGGFQVYQLDAALAEIGSDDALHHSLIAGIGRDLDRAFRDFQPFQHEVRKENVIVQADLRRCGGNHEVPPTFQQKSW